MLYRFWAFVAWGLRRWADYATSEALRESRHEVASLRSQLAISNDEVKRLALNHALWCERQIAEARIERARGVITEALNQSGERD